MCSLKETTFSCRHTQLSMVGPPCKVASDAQTAKTTKTTGKTNSIPSACTAGVCIQTREEDSSPCTPTCERERALRTLEQTHSEARDKIDKISERATAVEKAAEQGAPTPRFTKHGDRGWDAAKLEGLCKKAFEEATKLLGEYKKTKKEVVQELKTQLDVSRAAVKEFTVTAEGGKAEIVSFNTKPLVVLGDVAYDQLRDLVCEMERRASEACLEKQGWKFPEEDEEQCAVLRDRARWRFGNLSGTRMDAAYTGKPPYATIRYPTGLVNWSEPLGTRIVCQW
jgi:hypothetical protein